MFSEQNKNGAGVFLLEITKLLIRQKCNKCSCAVFMPVSQEEFEELTSNVKIKD